MNQKTIKHNPDYVIKTIVIGDSNVGKSNIVSQITENQFYETHLCTVGVDYKTLRMYIEDNDVKFLIWDTAGQERFKAITRIYFKGANCVIIVFDITRRNSFNNVVNWLNETKGLITENAIKILVGNKIDLEQRRTVDFDEAIELSKTLGFIDYIEVSAKTNVNLEEIFIKLANKYIDNDVNNKLLHINNLINIGKNNNDNYNKCC